MFALFYVAGAVLVWTISYFEVKHIRNSLLYTTLLLSEHVAVAICKFRCI